MNASAVIPALVPHWLAIQTLWPAILLVAGSYLVFQLRGAFGRRLQIQRKRLMTPTEVRFWHRLETALPDHRVFGQVSMGALLKPVRGLSRSDWWRNYGCYSQKIVDFVVVEARRLDDQLVDAGRDEAGARCHHQMRDAIATGEVVAIVELDDPSHNRVADVARDAMLEHEHGGYQVMRFDVRRFPTIIDIHNSFTRCGFEHPLARPWLGAQR